MCNICGKSVQFGTLFFLYNLSRKEQIIMDMNRFIDLLLEREDLKDIPMNYIFKVVCSVFDVLSNGNVFYKESL